MVRCTRLRWLATAAEACSEMPVLAASDTIATSFSPLMNAAGQRGHTYISTLAMLIQRTEKKSDAFFGTNVVEPGMDFPGSCNASAYSNRHGQALHCV